MAVWDLIANFPQRVKHDAALVLGKKSAETVGGAAAGAHGALSVATMGLACAVSAAITQIEHNNEVKGIRNFYKDELAAKLRKPAGKINNRDLMLLEKGAPLHNVEANPVIGEATARSRKTRNVGLVLAVAATLTALAVVHGLAPIDRFVDQGMGTVVQMLLGLLTYNAVKQPLHWVANKVFGLERKTTHERIVGIHRALEKGRTITREQVFETFVAANPELSEMIKSKYGKVFDKLPTADKVSITESIGKLIRLDEITDGINRGQVKPAELAFAVHGQASGVVPGEPAAAHKTGLLAAIGQALHRLTHPHHDKHPPALDEKPATSFAARFAKADTSLGHVARLDQSRSETAVQR